MKNVCLGILLAFAAWAFFGRTVSANAAISQEDVFHEQLNDALDAADRINVGASEVTFAREFDEASSIISKLRRSARTSQEYDAATDLSLYIFSVQTCQQFSRFTGDLKTCTEKSQASRSRAITTGHLVQFSNLAKKFQQP